MNVAKEMSNIHLGENFRESLLLDEEVAHCSLPRIDGALLPWAEGFLNTLLDISPLPPDAEVAPANALPSPRVSLKATSQTTLDLSADPLKSDALYHTATVKANNRITAADWYQDVRHFEFDFSDDIQ